MSKATAATGAPRALSLTDTSIGKKALVGITGAIMFGFVIVHLAGNMLVFLGEEALDDYGHMLHAIPELLWAARLVLLGSVLTHTVLTLDIARKARAARKVAYRGYKDAAPMSSLQTLGRYTMTLTGPLLLAYIVFHLAHLTGGAAVVPGYEFQEGEVYANVVHGFRVWWITAIYMAANAMLCLHLFHGGQALFQSLGLNHPSYQPMIKRGSAAFAAFVGTGNILIPLLVLARVVGGDIP
jgi:succinate dehydrogenase / fumarate reductase cytochrome b subunit